MSVLSLIDMMRSLVICEGLRSEPLLLCIERGQMRWIWPLIRMPPGHILGEFFQACHTGRRSRGRPRPRHSDYVSWLT